MMEHTDENQHPDLQGNFVQVKAQIADAAGLSARDPLAVDLIAVSKTKPQTLIAEALVMGQRSFGENRVQEAAQKFPELKQQYPDLCLHLIGPLQTNKVKDAVGLFDVFHTLDREKLIKVLARAFESLDQQPACLIQVNTGEEPQKAGVLPKDLPSLLKFTRSLGIEPWGLMAIPPAHELAPPHFAFLKKLAFDHDVRGPNQALPWLSMGMSGDFVDAIRLGATHVRVGSSLFGGRPPLKA